MASRQVDITSEDRKGRTFLATLLSARLDELGLNGTQASLLLGIHASDVSKARNPNHAPDRFSQSTLAEFCKRLGLEIVFEITVNERPNFDVREALAQAAAAAYGN